MEPYRPQVDREVLAFARSQTFTARDFVIGAKGVCRLHPELARTLAGLAARRAAQPVTFEDAALVLKGGDDAARP
jgi:hypothetical protein